MVIKQCQHCGKTSDMDLIDCEGTMMYKCDNCTNLNNTT